MDTRRVLVVVAVGAVALVAQAGPAAATVEGPCDATVSFDGGERWVASSGDELVVPEDAEVASWTGTTGDAVITDHEGEVALVLGPAQVPLGDWEGENVEGETDAAGDYLLADARDVVGLDLVGVWQVAASHAGDGGSCSGTVTVVVEGSPLSTPLGAGGIAGMVLGLAGLVAAGAGGAAAASAAAAGTAGGAGDAPTGPGGDVSGTPGDGTGGA